VENEGAKDMINNGSVDGRKRNVGISFHFLRELIERESYY
jgi:hypothetical protein